MKTNDFEQWGIPTVNYKVDGEVWYSTRYVKDIENKNQFVIPLSSFLWNNFFFICKGIKELLKILFVINYLFSFLFFVK